MKPQSVVIGVILALLFGYLFWHLIYSGKGAITLIKLSREKERLVAENKSLEESKKNFEKKVSRMKSESLDMDTLDEQARKNLGYSKDKEIIYVE